MGPWMMVVFAMFMLCSGVLGSDLVSSETLALGPQNPITMRIKESSFYPWPVASLCVSVILVLG